MKSGIVSSKTVFQHKRLDARYYVDHAGPAREDHARALRNLRRAIQRVRTTRQALREAEARERALAQEVKTL